MKMNIIILVLIMLCSVSACYDKNINGESKNYDSDDFIINEIEPMDITDGDDEKMQANRNIIAETLGVEENSRKLRFILNTLNTIQVGQIQSAEMFERDGENVLHIVGEDGTGYQIYLSGSGSVEAVKNLNANEWVIRSER